MIMSTIVKVILKFLFDIIVKTTIKIILLVLINKQHPVYYCVTSRETTILRPLSFNLLSL